MGNVKFYTAKRAYAESNGKTGDETLDEIAAWCDEHGWDELDSPAFNEWLVAQGISRDSLMIGKCRMPDYA